MLIRGSLRLRRSTRTAASTRASPRCLPHRLMTGWPEGAACTLRCRVGPRWGRRSARAPGRSRLRGRRRRRRRRHGACGAGAAWPLGAAGAPGPAGTVAVEPGGRDRSSAVRSPFVARPPCPLPCRSPPPRDRAVRKRRRAPAPFAVIGRVSCSKPTALPSPTSGGRATAGAGAVALALPLALAVLVVVAVVAVLVARGLGRVEVVEDRAGQVCAGVLQLAARLAQRRAARLVGVHQVQRGVRLRSDDRRVGDGEGGRGVQDDEVGGGAQLLERGGQRAGPASSLAGLCGTGPPGITRSPAIGVSGGRLERRPSRQQVRQPELVGQAEEPVQARLAHVGRDDDHALARLGERDAEVRRRSWSSPRRSCRW